MYELDLTPGAGFSTSVAVADSASATLGRVVLGGDPAGTTLLWIRTGGTCTTDDLTVGGTVTVSDANSILTVRNAGTLTIGSRGLFKVVNGGTFNAGTGGTILNNGAQFQINVGTASLGGITDNSGVAGSISLISGTLKASNLSSSTLGASPTIGTSQSVNITGTTTINTPVSMVDGFLVTGNLVISGGTFNFAGGFLQITGAQGLTIGAGGPLGSSATIGGTETLLVTGPTTIASGGVAHRSASVFQCGPMVNNGTFVAKREQHRRPVVHDQQRHGHAHALLRFPWLFCRTMAP